MYYDCAVTARNKQLICSNIMSFAVSCSYLQLAAGESINKPCKIDGQGWLKPIIYWVTQTFSWQWKHRGERAGARSAGGCDYWEHCASIIASHLEEEEKQEISQEEAFYLLLSSYISNTLKLMVHIN